MDDQDVVVRERLAMDFFGGADEMQRRMRGAISIAIRDEGRRTTTERFRDRCGAVLSKDRISLDDLRSLALVLGLSVDGVLGDLDLDAELDGIAPRQWAAARMRGGPKDVPVVDADIRLFLVLSALQEMDRETGRPRDPAATGS